MKKKIIILSIISIMIAANIATVGAFNLQSNKIEKNDELNFKFLFVLLNPNPPANNSEVLVFAFLNPEGLKKSFDHVDIALYLDGEKLQKWPYYEIIGWGIPINFTWPGDGEKHKLELIIDPDNEFPNEDKSDNTWSKDIQATTYPLSSYIKVEPVQGKPRSFKIKICLKNNWNKKLNVRFHQCIGFTGIVQDTVFSVPDEQYLNFYMAYPRRANLLIPYKFEPYEEKVFMKYTWNGVMNIICDPNNINPVAPEGNYLVFNEINPIYFVNGIMYLNMANYLDKDVLFETIELPAPDDKTKNTLENTNIIYKLFNNFPLILRLLQL